jgi:oligopeptide/dipeptide ABC transporter ATP-binding protein
MPENNTLLEVKDLKTHFPIRRGVMNRTVGYVKAVDGVSFSIGKGSTLGLVGESGCGKTTVGRTLMRLIPATAGQVTFDGRDVLNMSSAEIKHLRQRIQIMFQDPYGSLNPRMTIEDIIGEGMSIHKIARGKERSRRVATILEQVGLSPNYADRFPHEFSGGQRQRIGIARALAVNPAFIVCDEPVSALDVSIQSQIVNLLQDLQEKFDLTYLFIAHDLAVVKHISDYVAVMYLGRIVEYTSRDEMYNNPLHPYTKSLLSAIPQPDPKRKSSRIVLKGEVPSPANPPKGCHFHPRCPWAEDRCKQEDQALESKADGHFAACWKTERIS